MKDCLHYHFGAILLMFGQVSSAAAQREIPADARMDIPGRLNSRMEDFRTMSSSANEPGLFTVVDDAEFLKRLEADPQSAMCVAPRGNTIIRQHSIARLPGGFDLKADVYYREQKPAQPRPALVFMHDWASGKQPKICGDRQCNYLALTENLFCAALYYRQPGDGKFPAALQDLKTCLRWLRSIAGEYAIARDKIAVMGSSAGTQWTWLAAASNGSGEFDGSGGYEGFASDVNLAVINAGICDFVGDFGQSRIGQAIIGGTVEQYPEKYAQASPLHQVKAGMPPVLMLHGELDKTCPLSSAEAIAAKLREWNVPVELVVRKGCGHGLDGFGFDLHDNLEVVREFIRKKLGS